MAKYPFLCMHLPYHRKMSIQLKKGPPLKFCTQKKSKKCGFVYSVYWYISPLILVRYIFMDLIILESSIYPSDLIQCNSGHFLMLMLYFFNITKCNYIIINESIDCSFKLGRHRSPKLAPSQVFKYWYDSIRLFRLKFFLV